MGKSDMSNIFSMAYTVLMVLMVFWFMVGIYQWNFDNQGKLPLIQDMMPAFLVVMGAVFASGFQIITAEARQRFPKASKEFVLLVVAILMVFALPFIILVGDITSVVLMR